MSNTEFRGGYHAAEDGPGETAWAALGFLRFALALIVFGAHMVGVVKLPMWSLRLGNIGPYAAVLSFFFVSGYSIAHSLRRGPVPGTTGWGWARAFYGRRIDRIYPLYLWGMVLAAVPFLIWGQTVVTDEGAFQAPNKVWPFIGSFFFLQTTLFPPLADYHPTWSLTLEVAYYTLAPLLARAGSRVLVGLIAVSAVLYLYQDPLGVGDPAIPANHCSWPFLLWAWLGGFWFYRHRESLRAQLAVIVVGLWLLCDYDYTPGAYAALVLAGSLILVGQAHTLRPLTARQRRLGDYLGNLSYPLYILHMPLFVLIGSLLLHRGVLVCFLVLAGVVLSYHAIDAPYQRYARQRSRGARTERPVIPASGGPSAGGDTPSPAPCLEETDSESLSPSPAPLPG